jgi:hypothetical protein
MAFRLRFILISSVFLLTVPGSVYPQDQPILVRVIGESHHNFDPINITVTNTSSAPIDLAVPANIMKNHKESFRNPMPIDVERYSGDRWVVTRPSGHGGISRTIKPGQTVTFTFGVSGVGKYRARVWYVVDHGDPNPPGRKPTFGSVLSEPFEILSSM